MVRTLQLHAHTRPEPARILAIAAAIAIHVLAFLLLLLPLAGSPLNIKPAEPTPDRRLIPIEVPVTPLPPEIVKQQRRRPENPVPQPVARQTPLQQSPVVVDTGTRPAVVETVQAEITSSEIAIDRTPMTGAQLAYISAQAPKYPADAARAGAHGTVLLKVLVDIDGSPLAVTVERSSGHRSLDRAAREQVLKHWRFQPAVRGGHAVQAYGLVPIDFSMQ